MRRTPVLAVLLTLVAALPGAALASTARASAARAGAAPSAASAPGPAGFRSPSGNIHCLFVVEAGKGSLRCDVVESTAPPVRTPAWCEFDYGPYVGLPDRGTAKRLCVSDTVADPNHPVLAYGKTWTRGRITCTSSTAGIRCSNADRRGFTLSRAAQRLF